MDIFFPMVLVAILLTCILMLFNGKEDGKEE